MLSRFWSKEFLVLFLLTLFFAYIIGLTIITIINQRLTDIAVHVPTPQVNIQWPPTPLGGSPQPAYQNMATYQNEQVLEGFSPNLNYTNDDLRGFATQKEYADCTEATSQVQMEKLEQMNRVCAFRHDHQKYLCTYGKTNYMNPLQLDPINRRLYKHNYYPNMTLQDYINWLWLYEKEPEQLCYEHYRNLEKLRQGIPLKYQTSVCPPNLTADGSKCHSALSDIGRYYHDVMKYVDLNNMNSGMEGYNTDNYKK